MADTKVMYIVSYNVYLVIIHKGKYPKFEIPAQELTVLRGFLHALKITTHAYILRTVRFIDRKPIKILIPRVRYVDSKGKVHTEVILPDFLLPHTQYSVKSIASIILNISVKCKAIIHKCKDEDEELCISTNDFDDVIGLYNTAKYPNPIRYIKHSKEHLQSILKASFIDTELRDMEIMEKFGHPHNFNFLRKLYFITRTLKLIPSLFLNYWNTS